MGEPEEYEAELKRITHSGPHEMDDERRAINREAYRMADSMGLIPIDDIHKISDCDTIYRFLIAHRWSVENAVMGINDYATFREEQQLNTIIWEEFPEELNPMMPKFFGVDIFGNPVYHDKPDPKLIGALMQTISREEILRAHFSMMEQGRRLQKMGGADRVSVMFDCSLLTMGIITNPSAVGLLKEMSRVDQKMYPENMRTMLICNAPFAFSILWKVIRPLLDVRVQKKIQFISGRNYAEDVEQWISLNEVPISHGGYAEGEYIDVVAESVKLPPGTPPSMPGQEQPPAPQARELSNDAGGDQEEGKGEKKEEDRTQGEHKEQNEEEGGNQTVQRTASSIEREKKMELRKLRDESPLTEAYDDDDDGLEFHSLPSDDDEAYVESPSSLGNSYQQQSPPTGANSGTFGALATSTSSKDDPFNNSSPNNNSTNLKSSSSGGAGSGNSIVSAIKKPRIIYVQLARCVNAKGQRIIEGSVDNVPIAQTSGNLIVGPGGETSTLFGELTIEAGHPLHTYLMVVDPQRFVHFIFKKRNFHDQIEIYKPSRDAVLKENKKMKFSLEGERTHILTCRARPETKDKRDWVVTLHSQKGKGPIQAEKRGCTVSFRETLLALEPELQFTLAVALTELWHFNEDLM